MSISGVGTVFERVVTIGDAAERGNLATFIAKAIRLDDAAVIRLRRRSDDQLSAWAATGFDALAVRVVTGSMTPGDLSVGGDSLLAGLRASIGGAFDPGYSMDSAWRGALPPEEGYVHIDDLPARALIELAQQGAALAKEHGSSHGPPVSLLDQEVVHVEGGGRDVGISMRTVFALTAMGFIPHTGNDAMTAQVDLGRIDPAEIVRVRTGTAWLRLDARYGSVFVHLGGGLSLSVG